jgi:hypothetical protein
MLSDISEVDLEVNKEKSEYTFMSRPQNAGQNDNSMTANTSFENVTNSKYQKTQKHNKITLTNKLRAN